MRPIWRIEMLGTLQAVSGDTVIGRFRTRRVGLLLAYLAYSRDRAHSREELADLLWPDDDEALARRNLRQALYSLRHHLEPPSVPPGAVLVSTQSRVSLNPELVTSDVAIFEALLDSAKAASSSSQRSPVLSSAVELYRGDFLPGMYEEWAQTARLRLEDSYVAALTNLVGALELEGNAEDGIKYARMALEKDPLREELHAALIRLYAMSNRHSSALQHYREWKSQLRVELGAEPSPDLRRLVRQIEAKSHSPGSPSIQSEEARCSREASGKPKGSVNPPSRREHAVAPVQDSEPHCPDENASAQRSSVSRHDDSIIDLPIQLTRFFGRESDRRHAIDAIAQYGARLVTLVGPAGAGKTRLAIEAGRALAEGEGWNVWFVPFADLADATMALHTVTDSMRLHAEPGGDPIDLLKSALSGRKNLVILDNLEHVIESASAAIDVILRHVPALSVLATSRQSIKLEAEREIALDTLPVPTEDLIESGSLTELAAVPSVQMFVDRSQAVVPDFQITPRNGKAIGSICLTLEGLPLALEIAAGLSGAFTPGQLLQNLERRLELLRSRRRDIAARHRTLRAAIDYSFELLAPEMQRFFIGLSVFRGGFTIAAASEVCQVDRARGKRKSDACLRMVLDLQERSLIKTQDAAEGYPARFRLLESFREFAAEHLDAEQDSAQRERHARYFVKFGSGDPKNHTDPSIDGERENRLAALQFCFEKGLSAECVKLLEVLRGFTQIGRETVIALTESPGFDAFDPADQARLMRMRSDAHLYPSEFDEAYRIALKGIEIAERSGNEGQIAFCLLSASIAASYLGLIDERCAFDDRFLDIANRIGSDKMLENAYNTLGSNKWAIGDLEASLQAHEQGLALSTRMHGGEPEWVYPYNVGRTHLDLGHLDEGLHFANEGLRIGRRRNDLFAVSLCLGLIARYHRMKGNLAAAFASSREALIKRRRIGFLFWTHIALQDHAAVLLRMGRSGIAASLLAASRDTLKMKRAPDDKEFYSSLEAAKAALSESEFERAWAEGLAMSVEEAYRAALSVEPD